MDLWEKYGVSKELFLRAAFGSVAFVLLFLHSFVDQFFVTLHGSVATNAYTLDLPIYWMIIAGCTSFGVVTAILVKKHLDDGNLDKANSVAVTSLVYSVLIGLCMQAVLLQVATWFFGMLPDQEVVEEALDFLKPFWYLFFALSFYGVLSSLLVLDGGKRRVISCLVLSLIANIILDLIFTKVMHMGIFGNGLGTAASLLVSSLLQLEWFISKRGKLRLSLRNFDFGLDGIWMSVKAIRHFFVRGFFKNLCELIMRLGIYTTHALSYGIPLLCTALGYMFCTGVGPALGPEYVSMYNNKDVDGARRLLKGSVITMLVTMAMFSLIVFIMADYIAYVFTNNPSLTERHSVIVFTLRTLILSVPFFGLKFVCGAAISPKGRTNSSTIVVILWCFFRMSVFLLMVQHSYLAAILFLTLERTLVGIGFYLYARHYIDKHYSPAAA